MRRKDALRSILLSTLLMGLFNYPAYGSTQHSSSATPRILPDRTAIEHTPRTLHNPLLHIAELVSSSNLLDGLSSNVDFIKLQDIARRLWENQTGNKRKIGQGSSSKRLRAP